MKQDNSDNKHDYYSSHCPLSSVFPSTSFQNWTYFCHLVKEKIPNWLGPLERAGLNHWRDQSSPAYCCPAYNRHRYQSLECMQANLWTSKYWHMLQHQILCNQCEYIWLKAESQTKELKNIWWQLWIHIQFTLQCTNRTLLSSWRQQNSKQEAKTMKVATVFTNSCLSLPVQWCPTAFWVNTIHTLWKRYTTWSQKLWQ
jgi:hypothetical protein